MARPAVAIVHDYLTQRGGAERVVLSMLRTFPDAPLYTALYEPDSTYPEFAEFDVRPLPTNRVALLRHHHRCGLYVFPFVFGACRVDADVVLASSSGFAHGVRTTGHKIVYCYTPPRWLYDQADTYLAGWPTPVSMLVKAGGGVMRRWDKRAASGAEAYLTSSEAVRARINRVYGIDAKVIAPAVNPIGKGPNRSVPGIDPGFVLCVSRLLAYKNVDAVITAFERLPDNRLVIVGSGPEENRLRSTAGPNVTLLGRVDDDQLAWLYRNCAALVAAGHEDFGLTPLEASACGKPVAALRSGGYLDTVVEGTTGVFFDQADPSSIATAVRRLLTRSWDTDSIESHAQDFDEASFARRLTTAVGAVGTTADDGLPDGVAA